VVAKAEEKQEQPTQSSSVQVRKEAFGCLRGDQVKPVGFHSDDCDSTFPAYLLGGLSSFPLLLFTHFVPF